MVWGRGGAAENIFTQVKYSATYCLTRNSPILPFSTLTRVPCFFGFKMEFFSFQNNPKNLDLSYMMDLDFWDCLGRVKLVLL